jgi:DnaJ-class molecular chaperone
MTTEHPDDVTPGEVTPDTKGSGPDVCPECGGTGRVGPEPCESCAGTGSVEETIGGR